MIGHPILELQRVDSTNIYANTLLSKGDLAEGTVVWAHEQFAGRGQHNNRWESEAGKNLTFTLILKPVFLAPDRQFLLTKAMSLGVLDFIRNSLILPLSGIKWPNDIYIHHRKIAGILIENKILGNSLETSVVGIGVNINQTRYGADVLNPVSLVQLLHQEMELKEALHAICKSMDGRYRMLLQNKIADLDLAYHHNLLGFDQWRVFRCKELKMEGKICGVDGLGRLKIETRKGEILWFNHKEIEYTF